jgi:hypothetical protein
MNAGDRDSWWSLSERSNAEQVRAAGIATASRPTDAHVGPAGGIARAGQGALEVSYRGSDRPISCRRGSERLRGATAASVAY